MPIGINTYYKFSDRKQVLRPSRGWGKANQDQKRNITLTTQKIESYEQMYWVGPGRKKNLENVTSNKLNWNRKYRGIPLHHYANQIFVCSYCGKPPVYGSYKEHFCFDCWKRE